MKGVWVVTCDVIDADLIAETATCVSAHLSLPCYAAPVRVDSAFAYDAKRRQYNSALLLRRVLDGTAGHFGRVLALTEGDLFIPMLSFVFGQAQVDGPGAVVSLARLRQEFYGLPPDAALLLSRLRKEVLHEVGHTLSLVHCVDPACVMSLATSIRHVDEKSEGFCASCRRIVDEKVRLLRAAPLEKRS